MTGVREFPEAYLITFRCYGTWLHGDERGSVDRLNNRYGAPFLPQNQQRNAQMQARELHPPVTLTVEMRKVVHDAVLEVCKRRHWVVNALNVRSNHVHVVVTAMCDPDAVLSALKAQATRGLRDASLIRRDVKPWSHRGSRRYLWRPDDIESACKYVEEQ